MLDLNQEITCWGDDLDTLPRLRFSTVDVGRQADACALI